MSPYIFHTVHGTITPASPQAGRASPAEAEYRGDVGEGTGFQLGVGHVVQPLGEERRDVPVVAGSPGEDLRIAQPAEPLVPLRAVRRHADEVAALPPVDIPGQLVQPRLGGLERARGRDIRVHHPGHDVGLADVARVAGDLGVPESVQGEPRLEHLEPAARGELIGLPGSTQVLGVQAAVRGQHLAVPDPDLRAGRPVHAQVAASRSGSGRSRRGPAVVVGGDGARRDLLRHPDRRARVGDQRRRVAITNPHGAPAACVEAGTGHHTREQPVKTSGHIQNQALRRHAAADRPKELT